MCGSAHPFRNENHLTYLIKLIYAQSVHCIDCNDERVLNEKNSIRFVIVHLESYTKAGQNSMRFAYFRISHRIFYGRIINTMNQFNNHFVNE